MNLLFLTRSNLPRDPDSPSSIRRSERSTDAFSLIEILLAVSIMSVIVFGLFSMFNQTQKALIASHNQVDVLGAGRAVIELLTEDISQAESPGLPVNPGLALGNQLPHMLGTLDRAYNYQPVIQTVADGSIRTNTLQNFFYLTRSNLVWVAKGYFFSPSTNFVAAGNAQSLGFGTLFRYASVNVNADANASEDFFRPQRRMNHQLLENFWDQYLSVRSVSPLQSTNQSFNLVVSPMVEGVVHFHLQPIDSYGNPMRYYTNNPARQSENRSYPNTILEREMLNGQAVSDLTRFSFYGDSLPAFMELEIGVLDPVVLERVKSLPHIEAARNYLREQAGAVHLFRRMIPLSTAETLTIVNQ